MQNGLSHTAVKEPEHAVDHGGPHSNLSDGLLPIGRRQDLSALRAHKKLKLETDECIH